MESDVELELSRFYSADKSKMAVVSSINGGTSYVIDLYENDILVDYMTIVGKSAHYADDAAENYVLGIYKRSE